MKSSIKSLEEALKKISKSGGPSKLQRVRGKRPSDGARDTRSLLKKAQEIDKIFDHYSVMIDIYIPGEDI